MKSNKVRIWEQRVCKINEAHADTSGSVAAPSVKLHVQEIISFG